MDLQNIFYVMGIISMVLFVVLLIVSTVVIISIKNIVSHAAGNIQNNVHNIKETVTDPKKIALVAGGAVAELVLGRALGVVRFIRRFI